MPRIRLRADSSATAPTGAGRAISRATAARSLAVDDEPAGVVPWLGRRPASTIRRTVSSETPRSAAASDIRICVMAGRITSATSTKRAAVSSGVR